MDNEPRPQVDRATSPSTPQDTPRRAPPHGPPGAAPEGNGDPLLVQVQRPLLPDARAIAAYLDRIDGSRWYSNRGPLLWALEERLYTHFGVDQHATVLLASGSAALEAAILAHAGAGGIDRPLALMPSYTFVATALSAMRCGYTPYFLDVDPDTWMLDPEAVAAHPMLDRAGVVLPVAAYGRCPDMEAWAAVQDRIGVKIVVDAAAAFEQFERNPGMIHLEVPAVLSLHATKTFSTAEGGAVLWRSFKGQERVGRISNFGMSDARRCETDGFNGKLSEYHAAVGLAFMDHWADRRAMLDGVAASYASAAAAAGPLPGRLRLSPDVSGAYVLLECDTPDLADRACAALAAEGIGSRRWYGRGLHHEPIHAGHGCDPMPVTDRLGAIHVGLPAAVDLNDAQISRVVGALSGLT